VLIFKILQSENSLVCGGLISQIFPLTPSLSPMGRGRKISSLYPPGRGGKNQILYPMGREKKFSSLYPPGRG
jgi:hypothetical protein